MSQTSPTRLLLCLLALAAALVALGAVFVRAGGFAALPMHDFVEYWAAGRLLLQGSNPYDPDLVHELERQAGRSDEGILMWNPPWALPLVLPLGMLPVRTAHLVWLLVNLGVVAFCADRLWRLYEATPSRRWVALLLAATFLPTYFAIIAGQISPLLLLGAVLFLSFVRRGNDLCAGAACALLGVKPHLVYLFWLAVLLWSIRERRWRVLAGGVLAGVALTAVSLAFDPHVLSEYWHTLSNRPPQQYRSPTLGMLVRLALGDEASFRWQFLPLLPGVAWFGYYFWHRRGGWDWAEQFPRLLLVSMLTTPYGGWPFDLVLLLVPVVQVAVARPRLGSVIAHAGINGLALLMLLRGVEYLGFVWMTPALLVAYLALLHAPVNEPAPSARPA